MIHQFLRKIEIIDCSGMTKLRIGNLCDGGYVVLKEICEQTKAIYSFGVGDDVSFELDFVRRFPDVQVILFDPIIERLPREHPNFVFSKENSRKLAYVSSGLILKDSLLKMDVEWNEWEVLEHCAEGDILDQFSQILIEFHIVQAEVPPYLSPYFRKVYQQAFNTINQKIFGGYYDVLNYLCERFYIFHIHANNSLPEVDMGGYWVPPLLEMSFVRKDLGGEVRETIEKFPMRGLDFPNKPYNSDIVNYYPWRKCAE